MNCRASPNLTSTLKISPLSVVDAIKYLHKHYWDIDEHGQYGEMMLQFINETPASTLAYLMEPEEECESYGNDEWVRKVEKEVNPVEAGWIIIQWIWTRNTARYDSRAMDEYLASKPSDEEYESPPVRKFECPGRVTELGTDLKLSELQYPDSLIELGFTPFKTTEPECLVLYQKTVDHWDSNVRLVIEVEFEPDVDNNPDAIPPDKQNYSWRGCFIRIIDRQMGESANGDYDVGTEKPKTIGRVRTRIANLKNLEAFVKEFISETS